MTELELLQAIAGKLDMLQVLVETGSFVSGVLLAAIVAVTWKG